MFSYQGSDEGCGKWLSTKNTRRIGQLVKQKNARGATKGKKKQAVFKSDHLPGVVISSTPMSPRILEMLSRVKQAKVERFFKPVASKDKGERSCESEVGVKNDNGGLGKEVLGSYKTPILKRQHKMARGLEELQLWEDDDMTSSERHQDETKKLNMSGVLPIEKSDNPLAQGLHHSNTSVTNQDDPLMNSSPDDTIKSPVSKKFRCMTNESPMSPSSSFSGSLNDDEDRDSDSFHFTQWVNEQKRKSKELQGDHPLDSQWGTKLESSTRSSSSSSTELNRKFSQDIGNEIFSDAESQFRFSEWALEQKAKCKKLQNDLPDSAPKESLHKNLLECKSSSQIPGPSDLGWTESNFEFTEWVKEQKSKSKEIQHSLSESKQPPKTCDGIKTVSLNENVPCIPESEVFEEVESGNECGRQYQKNDSRKGEILHINEKDDPRYRCRNPSSREVLKDVSNEVMCSNGTSSKIERKHLRERLQSETDEEEEGDNTTSQESEYFHYTEWTRNQRQICKEFHKDPECPVKDDFWEIPEKDIKSGNGRQVKKKQNVLASDTDQESDSET